MSVLLGLSLAVGVLLILSPRLWPRGARLAERSVRRSRLRLLLDGAGMDRISAGGFVGLCSCAGLVAGAVVLGITGIPVVSGLAVVAGAGAPIGVAQWRTNTRQAAARRSWPDLIDHLVASVRSGVALPEALGALSTVGPQSLRPAFAAFAREYGATGQFGEAVDTLKARIGDPIADRIVETLRMAREVGGTELSTVLRGLAQHLRAEAAVRAELEARQSWVSNAARLGVAAPWIVLLLLSTRPETAQAFAGPGGVTLLLGGAILTVIAYRIMRRIGRLPTETRVFA